VNQPHARTPGKPLNAVGGTGTFRPETPLPVPRVQSDMMQLRLKHDPLIPATCSLSVGVASAVNVIVWITPKSRTGSAFPPARVAVAALLAPPIVHDLGIERGLAGKVLPLGSFEGSAVFRHAPGHQGGGHCHETKACRLREARQGIHSHLVFLSEFCVPDCGGCTHRCEPPSPRKMPVKIAGTWRRSENGGHRQVPLASPGSQETAVGLPVVRSGLGINQADAWLRRRFRHPDRGAHFRAVRRRHRGTSLRGA